MMKKNFYSHNIDTLYNGVRLDRFLNRKFGITQGAIQKALRKKLVYSNKYRIKSNTRLSKGDVLYIHQLLLDNKAQDSNKNNQQNINTRHINKIKKMIVFENDEVIAINKSYGIPTQGGTGISVSIDSLLSLLSQNNSEDYKLRLVHRLDRNTSGIMIIAKKYDIARKIADLFKNGDIEKTYYALVHGSPKKKTGIINVKIGEKLQSGERMMSVDAENGRDSITEYQFLSTKNNISVVKLMPKTGRKHQIRVHMAHLGYPIVGDSKYGKDSGKICLYAHSLYVPGFDKFIASPPEHMKVILNFI